MLILAFLPAHHQIMLDATKDLDAPLRFLIPFFLRPFRIRMEVDISHNRFGYLENELNLPTRHTH